MSVQFGRCTFDGKPVDPNEFDRVRPLLVPYGPDGEGCLCKDNIGVLYRAFHTTKESRNELQPHTSSSGLVITWDGRLDNRQELLNQLHCQISHRCTDLEIVSAAYEAWGTDAFARLIGDWAVSVWDPRSQVLVLAKDCVGTRHLYYSCDTNDVAWSTLLDPLVLFAGKALVLCEEYLAGWFSSFPAPHLTPYTGIHAVPPSAFVTLSSRNRTVTQYWDFDPEKRIRYRSDGEYEDHFRAAFTESVRRRLRSDSPVLAELSGGMDSSSIVCVADAILGRGEAETPTVDTVSYYNDSEPNWNERSYFTYVEGKRGREGCHIEVGSKESLGLETEAEYFAATPSSPLQRNQTTTRLAAYMNLHANRVVLSGSGGDEVTGGVPTPKPELEDLLAQGQFRELSHRLKAWALTKRKPWFHLLFEALRGFFPPSVVDVPAFQRPAPWLCQDFVKRNRYALRGYEARVTIFGALPTFQENLSTLNAMRRQLACTPLSAEACHEKRYPYLDRDLLEFLFAAPREQLVRPGQRRSLMRRALAGIVPDEVLQRRRKAFVARSPSVAISANWAKLFAMTEHMVSRSLGMVDQEALRRALARARQGQEVAIVPLLRTIAVETWLASLAQCKILAEPNETVPIQTATERERHRAISRQPVFSAEKNPTIERR